MALALALQTEIFCEKDTIKSGSVRERTSEDERQSSKNSSSSCHFPSSAFFREFGSWQSSVVLSFLLLFCADQNYCSSVEHLWPNPGKCVYATTSLNKLTSYTGRILSSGLIIFCVKHTTIFWWNFCCWFIVASFARSQNLSYGWCWWLCHPYETAPG